MTGDEITDATPHVNGVPDILVSSAGESVVWKVPRIITKQLAASACFNVRL